MLGPMRGPNNAPRSGTVVAQSLRLVLGGGTASLGGCTAPGRVLGGGTTSLGGGTAHHSILGDGTARLGGDTSGGTAQRRRWYSPCPGNLG